jgi:hypothetical protein
MQGAEAQQYFLNFRFFERSGGGNCEAISDGAERVLNFSILYTHYMWRTLHMRRSKKKSILHTRGKNWGNKCNLNLAKSLVKILLCAAML